MRYPELAEALGVSKWTAYEVLGYLERQGLVRRGYKKNPARTGRPVLVFTPTERGHEMADSLAPRPDPQEMAALRTRFRQWLASPNGLHTAQQLLLESAGVSPVELHAQLTAVPLLLLRAFHYDVRPFLRLVREVTTPGERLAFTVGITLGALLGNTDSPLRKQLSAAIERLLTEAPPVTPGHEPFLEGLLEDAARLCS